jgi:GNAT superfamily N-acetyltransferase
MGKLDIVHVGPDQLRVTPWRGDPGIAQVTPTTRRPPSVAAIRRCLDLLAGQGFHGALTSALNEAERDPFIAAGFTIHERLHLLRHDLRHLRDPHQALPGGIRLRRARRGDRRDVLLVDGLAFNAFWRFDERGLDDARRATPSSRFRVAEGKAIVGYAVTGRAGSMGYLQRLAVQPDLHDQGIGTALIMDALRWARRHRCTGVLVNTQESNERALVVYEHLGFVREPHGLAVLEHPLLGPGTAT